MTGRADQARHAGDLASTGAFESPFVHAQEGVRTVFTVTLAAASLPLLAGVGLFGWRAAVVAVIAITSCGLIEKLYYRVTRTPALLGRSHAYLTGVLLALTLPALVPWYVPLIAAAFAIIVGKAVFGGVGHFLWQPALVGRLAVAVMFPATLTTPSELFPDRWPVLAQNRIVIGDIRRHKAVERYRQWSGTPAPPGADAILVRRPSQTLAGLARSKDPPYGAIALPPEGVQHVKTRAALSDVPPMTDLLLGRRGGGIGETCILAILAAGLYLIYRNYVKWQLPVAFLVAAAVVAALGPVHLTVPGHEPRTVAPMQAEGLEVGIAYLCCHLLSGELVLAAFLLATEMTSRPVTTGGQVIFGLGCGALAMFIRLYVPAVPIPCYMAVLAMNTLTPAIDGAWRPRVLGLGRFGRLLRRGA